MDKKKEADDDGFEYNKQELCNSCIPPDGIACCTFICERCGHGNMYAFCNEIVLHDKEWTTSKWIKDIAIIILSMQYMKNCMVFVT